MAALVHPMAQVGQLQIHDLAGFFLQTCELAMVLMVAVVQKIEVLV